MKATEPVRYASEGDVLLALRDHFNSREYVVLPQVRNRAGFDATRTADAIVMSTWPSRGLTLYGVEIKVSRGDWLREMKHPEKSDDIAGFCDGWIVAVGDETIVKDGECPGAWGLLVPGKKKGTLSMKQPPTRLEARPMSRTFLARILRKALEVSVPLATVDAEIDRRVAERVAVSEKQITEKLTRELDPKAVVASNEKLHASIKAFKDIAGVWLDDLDADTFKRLAITFKLMQWSGASQWVDQLDRTAATLRADLAKLRAALPE